MQTTGGSVINELNLEICCIKTIDKSFNFENPVFPRLFFVFTLVIFLLNNNNESQEETNDLCEDFFGFHQSLRNYSSHISDDRPR